MEKNLTIVEIRLKFLRDLKGITQTTLANQLHVTQALVNSWENGYQNISLKQLIKVSYFYKVPIDYILGLTTKYSKNIYHFIPKLDALILGKNIRIIRKMAGLTQEEFALKLHTKRSNISYYESGKMIMSSADLKEICNTFGFSADWCLGSTNTCIRREAQIKIKDEEIKEFINI